MAFLGKEYKFERHENFDGFLKSLGLPDDKIQALLASKPTQKLVKDGDSYILSTTGPEGPRTVTFKSGVETDDIIGDGEKVKSTYTVEGNTVTHVVKASQGTATFKDEYNGDELVVTITNTIWDGVAKRYCRA